MLTDADSEGLLRDILDDPEDDGPRLIYADWLEEHDQPDRAEFIRVQVEKAQLEAVRGAPPGRGPCTCAGLPEGQRPCRWHQLAFREDRLHEEHYAEWERAAGLVLDLPQGRQWLTRRVDWRRGFVDRVALAHRDFLRHGGRLFGLSPITRVELSDKRPLRRGQVWSWLHGPAGPTVRPWLKTAGQELHRDPWVISRALWDHLRGTAGPSANEKVYGMEMEAEDDLVRACVAYGREQADKSPPGCATLHPGL